jgi:hypothetical protein
MISLYRRHHVTVKVLDVNLGSQEARWRRDVAEVITDGQVA